jgi:hypothetical protein
VQQCIDPHHNNLDEVYYYLIGHGFFVWQQTGNAPAPFFDHLDISFKIPHMFPYCDGVYYTRLKNSFMITTNFAIGTLCIYVKVTVAKGQ